jgi:hypothetical protein
MQYSDYSLNDSDLETLEARIAYWLPVAKPFVEYFESLNMHRVLPVQRDPMYIMFATMLVMAVLALIFPNTALVLQLVVLGIGGSGFVACGLYRFFKRIVDEALQEDSKFPAYDNSGVPFNMLGVELPVLLEFIDQCGGRSALAGMTTTQVCDTFVKRFTVDKSYCAMLVNRNDTRVRPANVFISHG